MCSKHVCVECVGISDKHFNLLLECPSAHWYCIQCEPKATKVIRAEFEVEERCNAFMKNMENRVLTLEAELKKRMTKDEVMELITEKEPAVGVPEEQVKVVVSSMLDNHSTAQHDRESRKKNVIIHHVAESEDNKRDDTEFLSNLKTELGVNEADIDKVVRLGEKKEESDKPRPMKVVFDTEKSKKAFMSKLGKLADAPDKFKNISVAHDMSKEEREVNRQLVEKAKKLNQDDPSDKWTYRVRGLPGNRKVMKIMKKT